MAYKILITGGRDWTDKAQVYAALSDLLRRLNRIDVIIIHGDCKTGADLFAKEFCEEHGIEQDPHPADWDKYKKLAGPIRNRKMVMLKPNICLAFWTGKVDGSGTFDCICRANKNKIRVVIYPKMD